MMSQVKGKKTMHESRKSKGGKLAEMQAVTQAAIEVVKGAVQAMAAATETGGTTGHKDAVNDMGLTADVPSLKPPTFDWNAKENVQNYKLEMELNIFLP